MHVALELFADHGYSHTSISNIATKAGISKGLLYNYFTGKEELLKEIMDDGLKEMISFFDPNRDKVLTREEFIYFINEVFDLMNRKITFYKLYFSMIMQPGVMKIFEKTIEDVLSPMLGMLTDYYARKGSKNPEAEAIMVGALLDGVGFNYVFNADLYPLDQVREMIIDRFV